LYHGVKLTKTPQRRRMMFAVDRKSVSTSSRPTFTQSHGALGVLNESPSCRSTDSVGLAAATNKLEFTYAIQCIPRRVLTYTQFISVHFRWCRTCRVLCRVAVS